MAGQAADFVFILADDGEIVPDPAIQGRLAKSVWPIPDPSAVAGTNAEQAAAFATTFRMIRRLIETFVELRLDGADRRSAQSQMDRMQQKPPHAPDLAAPNA